MAVPAAASSSAVKFTTIRKFALSLPEVTEEPHHHFGSFRLRGKIFVTIPPDQQHLHVFVREWQREPALATYPEFAEKLLWGGKVVGLRVHLAAAPASAVRLLVRQAWECKAPIALLPAGTQSLPGGLAGLANLGPKSRAVLAAAGIGSIDKLRRLGAVAAYAQAKRCGARVSLNLLWALEGALTGLPWQVVAREHRTSLLLALEQHETEARLK